MQKFQDLDGKIDRLATHLDCYLHNSETPIAAATVKVQSQRTSHLPVRRDPIQNETHVRNEPCFSCTTSKLNQFRMPFANS